MLSIRDMPVTEKPRERLITKGAESLSDRELLAVILGHGHRSESVLECSTRLIMKLGLKSLFSMNYFELLQLEGIGKARACQIVAIQEICNRLNSNIKQGVELRAPEDAVKLCAALKRKQREHLIACYVNTRHRLIAKLTLSIGNLNCSIVDPKEIVKHALKLNAYGVILLHNHPSGCPNPSRDDIKITKTIKAASELLGLQFIDHIIIASSGYISLSEQGLM